MLVTAVISGTNCHCPDLVAGFSRLCQNKNAPHEDMNADSWSRRNFGTIAEESGIVRARRGAGSDGGGIGSEHFYARPGPLALARRPAISGDASHPAPLSRSALARSRPPLRAPG